MATVSLVTVLVVFSVPATSLNNLMTYQTFTRFHVEENDYQMLQASTPEVIQKQHKLGCLWAHLQSHLSGMVCSWVVVKESGILNCLICKYGTRFNSGNQKKAPCAQWKTVYVTEEYQMVVTENQTRTLEVPPKQILRTSKTRKKTKFHAIVFALYNSDKLFKVYGISLKKKRAYVISVPIQEVGIYQRFDRKHQSIFWSNTTGMYCYSLETRNVRLLVTGIILAFAIDSKKQFIYYSISECQENEICLMKKSLFGNTSQILRTIEGAQEMFLNSQTGSINWYTVYNDNIMSAHLYSGEKETRKSWRILREARHLRYDSKSDSVYFCAKIKQRDNVYAVMSYSDLTGRQVFSRLLAGFTRCPTVAITATYILIAHERSKGISLYDYHGDTQYVLELKKPPNGYIVLL